METMVTDMMKNTIKSKGMATIEELLDLCLEVDAKLIGCQMTIDLFDMRREDFIDDIGEAATYFEHAGEDNINLFI